MEPIKLTVFSDYVCPWCYVGQGAIDQLSRDFEVELTWRPYYLRPDTPPEGMELPAHVRAHMAQTEGHLKQMAEAAGMNMMFPSRLPNTRLAHEATEYARQHGKELEFHRIVFDLYYGQGKDISQWEVLQQAARAAGLDPEEMKTEVEANKFTKLVSTQLTEAAQLGIDGVPTYVINDRYAIVGAQPYESFVKALQQIEVQDKIQFEKKNQNKG